MLKVHFDLFEVFPGDDATYASTRGRGPRLQRGHGPKRRRRDERVIDGADRAESERAAAAQLVAHRRGRARRPTGGSGRQALERALYLGTLVRVWRGTHAVPLVYEGLHRRNKGSTRRGRRVLLRLRLVPRARVGALACAGAVGDDQQVSEAEAAEEAVHARQRCALCASKWQLARGDKILEPTPIRVTDDKGGDISD